MKDWNLAWLILRKKIKIGKTVEEIRKLNSRRRGKGIAGFFDFWTKSR